MILASQENIRKYREMGVWTDNTLIDYLKKQAKENPDRICIVDPPNKNDLVEKSRGENSEKGTQG